MIGIVDGDILIYRCGFAAEKRIRVDKENGEFELKREVAPLSHAKQNLNTVLEHLDKKFELLEIYLSGKKNFRKEVAKLKPYKGNRSPFSKPVHYDDLRHYLERSRGAVITDGVEADDSIGIRATSGRAEGRPEAVIISTDKDLKQIPGKHYNWVKDEWDEITEREGLRLFYKQLLTGDTVDNIPGIYGIGPANASKIVDPYTKEKGMWQAVREEWHSHYPDGYVLDGTPTGRSVDDVLQELAQLLWIQRTDRIKWEPPT